MTDKGPRAFTDLANLPEDERIKIIAHNVLEHGLTVGVLVDDETGKAERYTKKLRVLEQTKGPVAGCVTLKVAPAEVN